MYYCRLQNNGVNPIEQLIKKQVPLEKFYDQNDFLSYLSDNKNSQAQLIQYLKTSNQITLLMDYCLFPQKIMIQKKGQNLDLCKYSYMSVMVFDVLRQDLVEHDSQKYLTYLFSYLDQDKLCSTSSSYFEQIMVNIFSQANVYAWMLSENNETYLQKFVKHIDTQQISELLLGALRSPIITKQKKRLLQMVIERFQKENEPDSEILQNISYLITELFKSETYNKAQFENINELTQFIYNPEVLNVFFQKLKTSDDSYNIFYTAQILLEISQYEPVIQQKYGDFFSQKLELVLAVVFYTGNKNTYQYEIATSYDQKIKHFGQGRMKTLEFIYSCIKFHYDSQNLMNKLAQSNFYNDLFTLFFTYTHNTKLSFLVEKILYDSVEINNDAISDTLINKVDIVSKIVENYRKKNIFAQYGSKQKNYKKGNVGSFTKIARTIKECIHNKIIQKYLKNSEKWQTFDMNKLKGLTKREEIEWEGMEIEELGTLPTLEHNWISYADKSMPVSNNPSNLGSLSLVKKASQIQSQNSNNSQLNAGSNKYQFNLSKNSSSNSISSSDNNKQKQSIDSVKINPKNIDPFDSDLGDLQLVKIKSTEFIVSNPNNPKELFMYTALYGCGQQNCSNPFCRNNPKFIKSQNCLSEFEIMKLTTPQNIAKFKPCPGIANQFSKQIGNSKLEYDHYHHTFGTPVAITQKNKDQTYWLKSSGSKSNDEHLIKDISAANHKQNRQTIWVLETVEDGLCQIRSRHYGYLLRQGSGKSNDKKSEYVGLGNYGVVQDQTINGAGRHTSTPGQDMESKWKLQYINSESTKNSNTKSCFIVNAKTGLYLTFSENLANNQVDKDVVLNKTLDQKAQWYICYQ